MKIFTLLHKSTDKGTINLGQWSRMGTVNVRTTSDSILSRICLASLILLMLGGFSMRAWARTSSINTPALWVSSTDEDADSVAWSASDVTFKLHNGGNIKLDASDHILIQKGYTYKLEWRVANGKTINVTGVSVRVRSTMNNSYMTVGSVTSGNVGPKVGIGVYTTVNSGTLSLGNNGYVSLRPESSYGDAIFHMDEITVTYTMDGVEKEVTFDSWNDYDHTITVTTDGPFVKSPEDGTTFTMGGDFKRYTKKNDESDTHFFLKNTTTGLFAKSYTGTLSWTQPTGYTIAVEGISINTFSRGKLYIWPNNDTGKEIRIIDNYTNTAGQTVTYVYNLTYTYSNNSTGYLFPGGNKMGVSDQFKFKATSNEVKINTLTVKYTLTPNTYSITLDNETPTTEVTTSVSVTYDSNNQLSITLPTKDGYTLDGWYTSETAGNGSGTKVIDANGFLQANVAGYTGADGIWIRTTTPTTLHAKWIQNSDKTITLNNQGATTAGTESMTVRFKTNGYSTGSTSISVPAKDYYHFAGYYSASSGGVQVIDAEGNVVADVEGYTDSDKKWINGDDETTLYAHWTGISYSVRFNANTGSGSMSNQDFVYGTAQNLTLNAFEKTCMVTYDANGGSCGIASSETPFSFLGWATSEEGAVVYSDGAEEGNLATVEDAVVDLYAVWSTSADTVVLPAATKTGYPFAGWYNYEDVCVGQAGDSIIPTGDVTLLAHWTPYVIVKNTDFSSTDGKKSFSWDGIHCTFTLSSTGNMTYTGAAGTQHTSIGKNCATTISWTPTNTDCDITVTQYKIVFGNPHVGSTNIYVNGNKQSIWGSNQKAQGSNLSLGTDGSIPILAENYVDIYSIELWYIVTPKAPTPANADLAATLSESAKQTLDVRVNSGVGALFTMADPASDFTYSYQLGADYGTHAQIEGNNFWADATGDYEVQARVNADEDHVASAWSTCTIHVVRTCVFNNEEGDKNWETTGNWAYNAEPTADDAVLVLDSLTVDKEIEMLSLSIDEDGVVTIAPTGGLTVGAGGISGATKDKLILKAQKVDDAVKGVKKGQTGYLRISPDYDGDMPKAKMEMLVKAYKDVSTGETKWQYVGSPVQSIAASAVFHYLYNWYEDAGKWKNKRSSTTMEPFKGYAATQNTDPDGDVVVFEGDLVSMGTQTVALTYTESSANPGCNVVANSFAAPIDISRMTAADFPAGAEATINFFNAGSKADLDARELTKAVDVEAAGQYIPVPVATASTLHEEFNYPIIIPSMQGFYVMTTAAGNMTLDYERLVWNADYDKTTNQPLRVNRRMTKTATERDEAEVTGKMKITLATQTAIDHLILLESEDYAAYYENGYDARKMMSDDLNIFSVEGDDQLAIDATNSIIGTRVGVRTGDETAYTLLFSSVNGEDEMALYDNETEQTIDINDGTQYTFFAAPNAMITGRFSIVEREAPSITTGVEKAENDTKVHKFIKDNQMYILKNGVLYNAMGAIVR